MATTDSNIDPLATSDLSNGYVGNVRGTRIEVDTATGAAWIEKYLHPPCDKRSTYAGIPDLNNTPSVHLEYRAVNDFSAMEGDGKATSVHPTMAFLQTSSAYMPVYLFNNDLNNNIVRESLTQFQINPNLQVGNMTSIASSGRIAYKSSTYELNATEFNNQGVVTVAQFRPNINLTTNSVALLKYSKSKNYEKFVNILHHIYCNSEFEIIDEKKKYNKGDTLANKIHDIMASNANNSIQIVTLGSIPQTSTDVLMLSPKAVSTKATEGAFVVQHFSQPVATFKDFGNQNVKVGVATEVTGIPCFFELFDKSAGTVDIFPFFDPITNPVRDMTDLPWSDLTWSWVFFEGLSVANTATATSLVTAPYITVKSITGYEVQPLMDSVLSPLTTLSAVYDESALKFGSMVSHQMQDSMPAKMNAIGAMLAAALKAAPTIITTIKSLFGKKETKKEAQTTKSTVDNLTAKVNYLTKAMEKMPANISQSNKSAKNKEKKVEKNAVSKIKNIEKKNRQRKIGPMTEAQFARTRRGRNNKKILSNVNLY